MFFFMGSKVLNDASQYSFASSLFDVYVSFLVCTITLVWCHWYFSCPFAESNTFLNRRRLEQEFDVWGSRDVTIASLVALLYTVLSILKVVYAFPVLSVNGKNMLL